MTAGTAAAAAFTPGSSGLGDPFFPNAGNGGYDVANYSLQLAYDPATDVLDGQAVVTARATQDLSRFNLDLRGFTISRLTVDGQASSFAREGQELVITPATGIRSGSTFRVAVDYRGVPEVITDPDQSIEGWIPTDDGAFVVGEPQGSPGWYPCNDNPRDKATFDFAVTVPEGLTAMANGVLVSSTTSGGRTTWSLSTSSSTRGSTKWGSRRPGDRIRARVGSVAVTPDIRREALFAARTRGEVGEGIASVLALLGMPDVISFAGGFPDPETFPRARVGALLQEFAAAGEVSAFQYAPTRGLAGPLEAFADRLESLQGRRPAEGELVITSGAIEALELLGKAFLDPGDLVVVEAPTYLGAIQAFRSFEADLVAVPMDEHGLEVDELERRLTGGLRPKLVYTIPDHQNPAGVSLASERREPLVELARRYGFLLVEDVAYRELGFSPEAPLSLWSLGPDVVVQTGTTSKTFFPGVRLGWAVGPEDVSAQLVAAKQNTDQCAGALGQRLFEESHRRGWIDEQLARSRSLYRRKCERLLAALERSLPEEARWTCPQGGFFSWLTLPRGVDSTDLARRAVERGVGIVPGSLFFPDGRGGDTVRLSFSLVDETQIDDGIERLGALLS
jgi:2-aminoadipate transaminase